MTASINEVFGNGSGTFGLEGNLTCQANAGLNPSTTAGDYVLAVYTLPANSLDLAGRMLSVSATGGYAATANNKRVKIIVGAVTPVVGSLVSGGTTIADSGTVTTSGLGWQMTATIAKYGATGSNTQIALQNAGQSGSSPSSLSVPSTLTLSENAPITIAVTGNATTATSDIALNLFRVNAAN